jgi:UDP-N-acetylglucosamine--N-acetylmuramyl-(pentapeptide) pyrophosphoryl-undecaprenol N-acetylglucosamine transferase
VGGSLGAAVLNSTIPEALANIPIEQRPVVIHQAGEKHAEQLAERYCHLKVNAEVKPFIEDMATAYANADLVICRAGAMTVSEISNAGVAACFVPFPYAIDDHQTANARFLSDAEAAILLPQDQLSPQSLSALLQTVSRAELSAMAQKAQGLAKHDATERVASICAECAK